MRIILWTACVVLLAAAGPSTAAEYVYLAEAPGECNLEIASTSATYSVYVYSDDYADITGVSFRVECERFGPEDITALIVPGDVTIIGGALFDGIELAFSARPLAHDPVLVVEVSGQETHGNAWVRDASLQRGAGSVSVPDFVSAGWPIDCFSTTVIWNAPDTVAVTVGKDDDFQFRAVVSTGSYPPNATVTVDDPAGWLAAPVSEDVHADCGWCLWDITTVTVPTHVPSGVQNGTLNAITLQMSSFGGLVGEHTVVLRAVEPVATGPRTIGGVKAIYR